MHEMSCWGSYLVGKIDSVDQAKHVWGLSIQVALYGYHPLPEGMGCLGCPVGYCSLVVVIAMAGKPWNKRVAQVETVAHPGATSMGSPNEVPPVRGLVVVGSPGGVPSQEVMEVVESPGGVPPQEVMEVVESPGWVVLGAGCHRLWGWLVRQTWLGPRVAESWLGLC
jgi:hypothetical protein